FFTNGVLNCADSGVVVCLIITSAHHEPAPHTVRRLGPGCVGAGIRFCGDRGGEPAYRNRRPIAVRPRFVTPDGGQSDTQTVGVACLAQAPTKSEQTGEGSVDAKISVPAERELAKITVRQASGWEKRWHRLPDLR